MPAIGYVAKADDGSFKDQLKTLSIRAEITIMASKTKASAAQPDYKVFSGDVEIGAGWIRRSEASGNEYISLRLVAPRSDRKDSTLALVPTTAIDSPISGNHPSDKARPAGSRLRI